MQNQYAAETDSAEQQYSRWLADLATLPTSSEAFAVALTGLHTAVLLNELRDAEWDPEAVSDALRVAFRMLRVRPVEFPTPMATRHALEVAVSVLSLPEAAAHLPSLCVEFEMQLQALADRAIAIGQAAWEADARLARATDSSLSLQNTGGVTLASTKDTAQPHSGTLGEQPSSSAALSAAPVTPADPVQFFATTFPGGSGGNTPPVRARAVGAESMHNKVVQRTVAASAPLNAPIDELIFVRNLYYWGILQFPAARSSGLGAAVSLLQRVGRTLEREASSGASGRDSVALAAPTKVFLQVIFAVLRGAAAAAAAAAAIPSSVDEIMVDTNGVISASAASSTAIRNTHRPRDDASEPELQAVSRAKSLSPRDWVDVLMPLHCARGLLPDGTKSSLSVYHEQLTQCVIALCRWSAAAPDPSVLSSVFCAIISGLVHAWDRHIGFNSEPCVLILTEIDTILAKLPAILDVVGTRPSATAPTQSLKSPCSALQSPNSAPQLLGVPSASSILLHPTSAVLVPGRALAEGSAGSFSGVHSGNGSVSPLALLSGIIASGVRSDNSRIAQLALNLFRSSVLIQAIVDASRAAAFIQQQCEASVPVVGHTPNGSSLSVGAAAAVWSPLTELLPPLLRSGHLHWNSTVNKYTSSAVQALIDATPALIMEGTLERLRAVLPLSPPPADDVITADITCASGDFGSPTATTVQTQSAAQPVSTITDESGGLPRDRQSEFAVPPPKSIGAARGSKKPLHSATTTTTAAAPSADALDRMLSESAQPPSALASSVWSGAAAATTTTAAPRPGRLVQPPVTITGVAPWAIPTSAPLNRPAMGRPHLPRTALPAISAEMHHSTTADAARRPPFVPPQAPSSNRLLSSSGGGVLQQPVATGTSMAVSLPHPAAAGTSMAVSLPEEARSGAANANGNDGFAAPASPRSSAPTGPVGPPAPSPAAAGPAPAATPAVTASAPPLLWLPRLQALVNRFKPAPLALGSSMYGGTGAAAASALLAALPDSLAFHPTLLPELGFHDLVFGRDLGSGSFSTVRYARHIQRGLPVALWPEYAVKVISTATLVELDYERAASREIAVLSSLHHPNIARLVSAFRWRDGAYLIMEYAGRGDLHDELQATGGRLEEDAARCLLGEVLCGLRAVHEAGFAFGDCKPENIVLLDATEAAAAATSAAAAGLGQGGPAAIGGRGVHAKLTDFGACRPITAAARIRVAESGDILKHLRDGDWRVRNNVQSGANGAGSASSANLNLSTSGGGGGASGARSRRGGTAMDADENSTAAPPTTSVVVSLTSAAVPPTSAASFVSPSAGGGTSGRAARREEEGAVEIWNSSSSSSSSDSSSGTKSCSAGTNGNEMTASAAASNPAASNPAASGDVIGESEDEEDGRIEGTAEYLAPELADGTSRAPSVASDAYAFGVTLFQVLSGLMPPGPTEFWPTAEDIEVEVEDARAAARSITASSPFSSSHPSASSTRAASHRGVRFQTDAAAAPSNDPFPLGFPTGPVRDLIRGLLHPDPAQRLGGGPEGLLEVARHAWFSPLGALSDGGGVRALYSRVGPPLPPRSASAGSSIDANSAWSRRHNSTIWSPLPRSYTAFMTGGGGGGGGGGRRSGDGAGGGHIGGTVSLSDLARMDVLPPLVLP